MISIIVPVYNLEKYISRTIDSILKQSYQDIEIIIVNDGSTDGSKKIIDDYADRYPEKIRCIHIENGGVTNARLTGVENAKGEWIGFVDGDDTIENNMYEKLLSNALKYNSEISHCGFQLLFEDGRINYFHNSGILLEQNTNDALKTLLAGELIEPGLTNKLFHKNLFDKAFSKYEMDYGIRINEDLLMNYMLFSQAEKSVFEDVCLYHYIERSNSASRAKLNVHKIYDPIKVKEMIVKMANAENLEDAKNAYINTCIDVYSTITCTKDIEHKSELKNIRKYILENRSWIKKIGFKRKILATIIVYTPWLYGSIYNLYRRYFFRSRYE